MFLSLIGCVGLVITETLGIKEYKNTFNKKRKINNEFKNKIESTKTETYNYSLNNNVDYSKITKSFINYFDEKYYPCSYSIDLLYKIIFGMQQSGYTNDEIAEYIVSLMYEEKNKKGISKSTKVLTKIKVK